MHTDFATPALTRLIDADAPLDHIAQGMSFGEGSVWDKRNGLLYWGDIIGNTLWRWRPGVGREVVLKPSGHFVNDRSGRLYAFSIKAESGHTALRETTAV